LVLQVLEEAVPGVVPDTMEARIRLAAMIRFRDLVRALLDNPAETGRTAGQ